MKKLTRILALFGLLLFLGNGSANAWFWRFAGEDTNWERRYESGSSDQRCTITVPKITGAFGLELRATNNEWDSSNIYWIKYWDDAATVTSPSWVKVEKAGENFRLSHNLYNVTITLYLSGDQDKNLDRFEISGSPFDPNQTVTWKMHSTINSLDWSDITFSGTGTTRTATVTPKYSSGKFVIFGSQPNNQDVYYKVNNSNKLKAPSASMVDNSNFNASLTMAQEVGSDGEFAGLDPNSTYTLTWNTSNNTLSIAKQSSNYPEYMYLYGHLNNRWWDKKNYAPLKHQDNGLYKNEVPVEISGCWSYNDSILNTSRRVYGTTGDENYVAVYKDIQTKDNFDRDASITKYGSYRFDNDKTNEKNEKVNKGIAKSENGSIANLDANTETQIDNFVVPEGYYDVEVNLANMTIKFIARTTTPAVYTWFSGSGNVMDESTTLIEGKEGDNYVHGFTFGDGTPDVVQVGIGDNPMNRVARQSDYTVRYKPLSKDNLKRKADGTFADATDGVEYTTIGSTEYHSNHMVQLNLPGVYEITANLIKNPEADVTKVYDRPEASTIMVTVNDPDVTYTINSEAAVQGWSNKVMAYKGVVSLTPAEDGITLDPSEITVAFDRGDEGEWKTSGYPDGFEQSLISQWETLVAEDQTVDGFWDASKVDASLKAYSDNTYTIEAQLPCSGKYKVTLSSDKYNLTSDTEYTVVAYPSIRNIWVSEAYMNDGKYAPLCVNINGITMDTNSDNTEFDGWKMSYPFLAPSAGGTPVIFQFENLANSVVYTPGIYLADMSVSVTETQAESRLNGKRNAPNLNGFSTVDLSKMAGNDQGTTAGSAYEVSIILTKNGATTKTMTNGKSDEVFIVTPSTSAPIPTGVESVEVAEEGETVYYNLQGQRVDNPEHGIFVKVKGGKAEKIVL